MFSNWATPWPHWIYIPQPLKQHIFSDQESYNHEWFLRILIFQLEPKTLLLLGILIGGMPFPFQSLFSQAVDSPLLSVPGARGEREGVEASPGRTDWEGPFNLRQHAAEEGSLAQPSSHMPPSCHQVAMALCLGPRSVQVETILVNCNYFNTLRHYFLLQQELRAPPEDSHMFLAGNQAYISQK